MITKTYRNKTKSLSYSLLIFILAITLLVPTVDINAATLQHGSVMNFPAALSANGGTAIPVITIRTTMLIATALSADFAVVLDYPSSGSSADKYQMACDSGGLITTIEANDIDSIELNEVNIKAAYIESSSGWQDSTADGICDKLIIQLDYENGVFTGNQPVADDEIIITITEDGAGGSVLMPDNPITDQNYLFALSTESSDLLTTYDTLTITTPVTPRTTQTATVSDTLGATIGQKSSNSQCINDKADFSTTTTTIPWSNDGTEGLSPSGGPYSTGNSYIGCQTLEIVTNATSGYEAYVYQNHNLQNALSDTIGQFNDGTAVYCNAEVCDDAVWAAPTAGNAISHLGYTTSMSLGTTATSPFTQTEYAAISSDATANPNSRSMLASGTDPTTGDVITIEYQLQMLISQATGTYSHVIYYVVVPKY